MPPGPEDRIGWRGAKTERATAGVITSIIKRIFRGMIGLIVLYCGFVALSLAAFRIYDPPITPLMVIRKIEGQTLDHRPGALAQVAQALPKAVIAAEDTRFCLHRGVDLGAVEEAMQDYTERGRLRGASTITMQVARNLFLWPGGGFARKGLEIPLALALDALWSKRRILEIYLQIAEWGPGIFGVEAAARQYFNKPAAHLNHHEAALLAAILPSPLRRDPTRPSAYVAGRANMIGARATRLSSDLTRCF